MDNNINSVKDDLKGLCIDFIKILDDMKKNNIISEDDHKEFIKNKIKFIND